MFYDSAGHLIRQLDALGKEATFTYDTNGNRLTETRTRTTPQEPLTLVTANTYDEAGRVTRATLPDGSFSQVRYNLLGQATETIDRLGRSTVTSYDERGRQSLVTFPDGTATARAYDDEGRLISTTDRSGRLSSTEYDPTGRVDPGGPPGRQRDYPQLQRCRPAGDVQRPARPPHPLRARCLRPPDEEH